MRYARVSSVIAHAALAIVRLLLRSCGKELLFTLINVPPGSASGGFFRRSHDKPHLRWLPSSGDADFTNPAGTYGVELQVRTVNELHINRRDIDIRRN
jgi:hypothetical protein